jgi:hypothetical protein
MHTNPSTLNLAQVISIMYLFEEMARELIEGAPRELKPYSVASPPNLVYGWTVETSNPSAAIAWHTDFEGAKFSVICQCEPGETSMEIAGEGQRLSMEGSEASSSSRQPRPTARFEARDLRGS